MKPRIDDPRALVVIHEAPVQLAQYLEPDVDGRVSLVSPPELSLLKTVRGLELRRAPKGASVVVGLSADGPRASLELVIAGLLRDIPDAAIALGADRRAPPPWWAIDAVCRLGGHPAVDLRRVQWCDSEGLWWTTATGPRRLPLDISSARSGDILAAASGLDPASPLAAWLAGFGDGRSLPGPERWSDLLAARFSECTASHLQVEVVIEHRPVAERGQSPETVDRGPVRQPHEQGVPAR